MLSAQSKTMPSFLFFPSNTNKGEDEKHVMVLTRMKSDIFFCHLILVVVTGNLLRSGDVRGYQSMARMYTRLAAMPKKG